jgi:hypothetical protein
MREIKLTPIMHGDCMRVENSSAKANSYYKIIETINIINGHRTSYIEIDGKVGVLFDAYSKYGVIWYFPN